MKKLILLLPLVLMLSGCGSQEEIREVTRMGVIDSQIRIKKIEDRLYEQENKIAEISQQLYGIQHKEEGKTTKIDAYVGCISGDIMGDYCFKWFYGLDEGVDVNPKGYLNSPTIQEKGGKFWQFCFAPIPSNQYQYDGYKECK